MKDQTGILFYPLMSERFPLLFLLEEIAAGLFTLMTDSNRQMDAEHSQQNQRALCVSFGKHEPP